MDLIKAMTQSQLKEIPEISIGDTLRIHNRIKEGTLIARKHGGISETITLRRMSYGIGVEKTFPLHSPNIAKIEVVRRGKVRRAKLYYLRGRVGKAAKVKQDI